jgi:hypothetical protein
MSMGILRRLVEERTVEETLLLEIGLQRMTKEIEGIVGMVQGKYYMDNRCEENHPAIPPERAPMFVRYCLHPYVMQKVVFVYNLYRNKQTGEMHHVVNITPKEPQQGVPRDRVVIEYDTRKGT